ncbi:MAG: chemotaxis response regulator protein-glutamate methylesterase [Anaerolinea sp.]|nr:chemotaxis response regulator protein-glutamate methylesterase [Anaerolinea sp.]
MAYPAPAARREIRVLIVDDSAFMRRAMERLIEQMPGVTVAGTAGDGLEGIKRALELRPDVITMDVEMPKMDGVAAVGEIMRTVPTPIVMVSTLTSAGADTTMRALEAGAVEAIAKPSGLSHDLANVGERLAEAIQRASFANVRRARPSPLVALPRPASPPVLAGGRPSSQLVVIGSSTGGPPALTEVVPHLPADLNAGVLIVQHMPAGFTGALARRLDALSPLNVAEAVDGEPVRPGRVLIAPGDFHLVVTRDRRVRLEQGPTVHGVRPSVDVTLNSVAEVYGGNVAVAILTGMGKDGADGAVQVERAGGRVITQDEATSVVYGMPRVAREKTQHAQELPLDRIADALARALPGWRGTR